MNRIGSFLLLVFCLIYSSAFSQKGLIKQADKYLKAEKYFDALKIYNSVENADRNPIYLFNKGYANLKTNHPDIAILDFQKAKSFGNENKEIYYYTGLALLAQEKYSSAAQFFKNYLKYADRSREEEIVEMIKRCQFGLNNLHNNQLGFVENIGQLVNTQFDEIGPVQSPTTPNKYYFSSNRPGSTGGLRNNQGFKDEILGHYFLDMYAVQLNDGNWTSVSTFNPILQSASNDIIQGFSPNGDIMYFVKNQDGIHGQLLTDTFRVDREEVPLPSSINTSIVTQLGDKDIQVFNDNTIIFSSKREGGYGGYDLYVTYKKDSLWMTPINLGSKINTAFDEISPFLAKSGKKLYFSSDRLESYGGFDVFTSDYDERISLWSDVSNIGRPINSPNDDKYFSVTSDGMTAILSSDRVGAIGGSDIFIVYFKDLISDQMLYTELLPFIKYTQDSIVTISETIDIATSSNDNDNIEFEIKEIVSSPLYYGDDDLILTPSNISKLNDIVDVMKVYPELKVIFTGSSFKDGMKEFNLYFSIKRAEKSAKFIIDKGIDINRISVKGLGSNYPHTKEGPQNPNMLSQKNNRRIDVKFFNIPTDRLVVIKELPKAADYLIDPKFEEYKSITAGLSYRLKIATTTQMYKGELVKRSSSSIVERRMIDNEYIYTVGLFNNYSRARSLKNELIRQGKTTATIKPYIDGVELPTFLIESKSEEYFDLKQYLLYEY
ncbi:MAG: OmpA family protein [Saprospiraceae bacterium]